MMLMVIINSPKPYGTVPKNVVGLHEVLNILHHQDRLPLDFHPGDYFEDPLQYFGYVQTPLKVNVFFFMLLLLLLFIVNKRLLADDEIKFFLLLPTFPGIPKVLILQTLLASTAVSAGKFN